MPLYRRPEISRTFNGSLGGRGRKIGENHIRLSGLTFGRYLPAKPLSARLHPYFYPKLFNFEMDDALLHKSCDASP